MTCGNKKQERLLEALQAQRGLTAGEVSELLDIREARYLKNYDWAVSVGRLEMGGDIFFSPAIAAQKQEER